MKLHNTGNSIGILVVQKQSVILQGIVLMLGLDFENTELHLL